MTRRFQAALLLAAALLLPCMGGASAQVPTPVDDVHISSPNTEVPRLLGGGRDTIAAAHITLIDLIRVEYSRYSPDQIIGLTPEQRTTRFNVVAKIDPPGVSDPEHDPHAQAFVIDALLKNHFRLVVHETEKPVVQLGKVGSGMRPNTCLPDSSPPASDRPAVACITMDEFAARLSNELHILVDNTTNLPGTFAIAFTWPPQLILPPSRRGGPVRVPQNLQTTLINNFGLFLAPDRNLNKVLVVDHVELPTTIGPTKTVPAE